MNPHTSVFSFGRASALQKGQLLDITPAAAAACIGMPSAVSERLWRKLAENNPLTPSDPRALSLCWSVFLFVNTKTYTRERQGRFSRTVWFNTKVLGRSVDVKAIAHGGDRGEPVMTLLCADEPDPFDDLNKPV